MEISESIDTVKNKAASAVKWSLLTEVVVKIITPLTQVLLAHILAPEAFGVVATVTMVVSFADMLSDAGFQKYLVQHDFDNQESLFNNAHVAFWTNLCFSLSLWVIIIINNDYLADSVGCSGLGNVLILASASLPLTAFSSIQLAIFHREFEFKDLLVSRVSVALVPMLITVPLAFLGFNYWAIVIGTVVGNLVNALVLTKMSKWKPKFFFSFSLLKDMLSFSLWTLLESLSIWLTSWVGTFVLGSTLSAYYLGLYKTSTGMVNAAMGIVTSATTPILFSALSRCQDDEDSFESVFFDMQLKVALFVVPLGVGIFVFRDFATELLMGPNWLEASDLLGLWGLSSSLVIVLSHYASEVFRAKGRPKLSFANQCLYLCLLIPAMMLSAQKGFVPFSFTVTIVRVLGIFTGFIFLRFVNFPVRKMLTNILTIVCCSFVMGILGLLLLKINSNNYFCVLWIFTCMAFYAALSFLFPKTRSLLLRYLRYLF